MKRILILLLCPILLASYAKAADKPKRVLRIIAFGAHPDDAEFQLGGCAIKWAQLGHKVKLVSVTNGDIGHWKMAGGPLAKRRTAESQMGEFPVEHLTALCPAIVLDDEKKARAIGLRGQRYFTEAIRHWYNPGGDSPPPRAEKCIIAVQGAAFGRTITVRGDAVGCCDRDR